MKSYLSNVLCLGGRSVAGNDVLCVCVNKASFGQGLSSHFDSVKDRHMSWVADTELSVC